MSSDESGPRRIAIVGNSERYDVGVPAEATVGQALEALGLPASPHTHTLLTRSGREVAYATRASDLSDGSVLSLVDLGQKVAGAKRKQVSIRADHAELWWGLSAGALALAVGAVADKAWDFTNLSPTNHRYVAGGLAVLALLAGLYRALRPRREATSGAPSHIAPLALAFAAGAALPQPGPSQVHAGVAVGFTLAGVLTCMHMVITVDATHRSNLATLALVLLGVAAIWGITLWLDWGAHAAAALSMAAAVPALRAVPQFLLNFEEGFSISFKHFMTSRWTVRGAIPEEQGRVTMGLVAPRVDQAIATSTASTVALVAMATLASPFAATAFNSGSRIAMIATHGLFISVITHFTLSPRKAQGAVLRWTPRVGAALVTCVYGLSIVPGLSATGRLVAISILMILGMSVAWLVVPVSRGMRSLVLSRVGDVCEALSVVLALPLGLLAADVLEAMRRMVAS